ncbi:MAG: competence/damage-inducible protein A [Fimbriimonadaceae bacterium]|nr:MAG: competence/damage-inducible protein A [Fimbriimonadaceae bacterium]
MTVEIVSIGTELLMGQTVDTHAATLGRLFPEYGIVHRQRQTVGDNKGRILDALRLALSRSDWVITIGGLGPTEDDLTRECVAEALDLPLHLHPDVEAALRQRFAQRKAPWTDSQARQALFPRDAALLENLNGTAPGFAVRKGEQGIISLPGPRNEFVPMVEGPLREFLAGLRTGEVFVSRTLRVAGMGESLAEERIRDLLHLANPTVAPYAQPGEVQLRITARAESTEEARALIAPVESEVRRRLGEAVFGADSDTLEQTVLELLRRRGLTLAVAESCTGGGLAYRLTSVPGSSEVFLGGVVSYANEVKVGVLGVEADVLTREGAVSKLVARQMAQGVRRLTGADIGVGITGIAGPGGGSPEKPVGLVYVGFSGPLKESVEELRLSGSRETIRLRSISAALDLIRRNVGGAV